MKNLVQRAAAVLFFLSGFCGLVYQVVWLRLAFGQFGIITPVLSVVLSTFMLGLALGSWGAGNYAAAWPRRTRGSAIWLYALCELLIGCGAHIVPHVFAWEGQWLLRAGEMGSAYFLALSALMICIGLLPWCVLMGMTFPLMMAFLKEREDADPRGFSLLYAANVFGAFCGTVSTAVVWVELFGLQGTLSIASGMNFLAAAGAAALALLMKNKRRFPELARTVPATSAEGTPETLNKTTYALLFITGFTGMALEVVWTRAFTMVLHTTIYSFALILSVYLLATWVGSLASRRLRLSNAAIYFILTLFSYLPILLNDPRMAASPARIAASIFPLCAALGYLTPRLIDEFSEGLPRSAGRAYAVNTVGCIGGPLFTSYLLLPYMGVRVAMIFLSLPFFMLMMISFKDISRRFAILASLSCLFLLSIALFGSVSYEEGFRLVYANPIYRRDHTATVVSCGTGFKKNLFVNGIPMTSESSITKMMAHLPLAFLRKPPVSALDICFGMGTTYRSLLSWNIQTTAVELVPSVKAAFPYYFDDAEAILKNPKGRIIIDDGRRYLKRTGDRFDVVTIDPPPPIEAAGSSLLYSAEFYRLVKSRLSDGGILQQWIPSADEETFQAVVRSLVQSFPYVKVFPSFSGYGHHFLASSKPLRTPSPETFVNRLPPTAQKDLMEWYPTAHVLNVVHDTLVRELPIQSFLSQDLTIKVWDDRPYNEYFLLRQWRAKREGRFRIIR